MSDFIVLSIPKSASLFAPLSGIICLSCRNSGTLNSDFWAAADLILSNLSK